MKITENKSYSHGSSDIPLIGLTCHQLLEKRAEEIPDQPMYIFRNDDERITFSEFKNKVEQLAAGLLAQGLKKGDCVAATGGNHLEWPLLIAATRAIGVMMLRMQTGYTIETMKQSMIKTSCKALFLMRSPEDLYKKACVMMPELERSEPGKLKSVEVPSMEFVIAVGVNNQSGTFNLNDILKLGNGNQFIAAFNETKDRVSVEEISHFSFTSGSTGEPKMVPYSQFNCLNGTYFSLDYMMKVKERSARRILCSTSMSYVAGEMTGVTPPIVFGITAVFPYPTYNFEKLLEAIHEERCTDVMMFLYGLIDLVKNPDVDKYDLTSVKIGLTGGSPVPPSLFGEIYEKYGIKMLNSYAASETFSITSQHPSDKFEYSATTVGKLVGHVEMKVVDKSGISVQVGQEGEVWVRSPFACTQYHLNTEATNKAFTEDGWLKTGDVGELNEDGYLAIKGRKEDTLNRVGRKLYPIELENVVAKHPAVKKVQVVGVPNERLGDAVCVCIIPNDNWSLTLEEIRGYCVEKVTENGMPDHIVAFDKFPCTTSGKFDRLNIKKIAMERLKLQ